MGTESSNAGDRTVVVKTDPVHVGLTGGIGSGKSTVAAMLQKLGAAIVDADAISRATTAPNGAALPAIATCFGPDFLSIDGALNRQKMRETIFRDPAAKSQLEHILHPLIRREMLAEAAMASSRGVPCVVFDIPLLVESGAWRNFVDSVLVVDCTPETQIQRVKERNGLSEEIVLSVISTQANRNDRLRAADIILFNDGCSLEQLATCVQAVASKIGL